MAAVRSPIAAVLAPMFPVPATAPSGLPAGLLAASKFGALDRLSCENVSHKLHSDDVEFRDEIDESEQIVDGGAPLSARPGHGVLSTYYVKAKLSEQAAPAPVATGPTRTTKAQKARVDGRRRRQEGPLNRDQIRELGDARAFAADLDRALTCAIDVQPSRLDTPPDGDIGEWFRNGPLRIAAQAMNRQKDSSGRPVGWFAIATRENYEDPDGANREHGHIVCHCPRCFRPKLAQVLAATFPGDGAIHVHGDDELDDAGWDYRLKQRAGNAAGRPGPYRKTPQTHAADGAPVASVLGKRIAVSRSLGKPERIRAGWQAERDEARAVAKMERTFRRARDRDAVG